MSKKNNCDILVVGMGMAGLMAAHTAITMGKHVTLLATGMGALSIASGCIDVLGYLPEHNGQKLHPVQNPLQELTSLANTHPYTILGRPAVEEALQAVQEIFASQEAAYMTKANKNTLVPTIIGTLKPTYIYPAANDSAPIFTAKKVLVVTVDALRDCHPKLIIQQLQRYKELKNIAFSTASLPSHFGKAHRAVSALDVARHVDSPAGYAWLVKALKPLIKEVDAILLPPILGTKMAQGEASIWKKLQAELSCPVVEMLSLPPAVGGHRLYTLFMQALRTQAQNSDHGGSLRIIENATITQAEMENGRCTALISQGEGLSHRHEAKAFILATGGILGGGIETEPGKAYEKILGIAIDTPEDQEKWAGDDAFSSPAFTQMGVKVNEKLQAVDASGQIVAENIYFAGRTLANYDFAAEKSGNGVALATGYKAAYHAATSMTAQKI